METEDIYKYDLEHLLRLIDILTKRIEKCEAEIEILKEGGNI